MMPQKKKMNYLNKKYVNKYFIHYFICVHNEISKI